MGKGWRDCIVVMYDLIGIKQKAESSVGSTLMRQFMGAFVKIFRKGYGSIHRVYCWNDSALLLAHVDDREDLIVTALKEADTLKRHVDGICKSFAVAIRGQTFPLPPGIHETSRVTVIEASSYAMANCFLVAKQVKKLKGSWYVDSRIAKHMNTTRRSQAFQASLLPSGRRTIQVFDDYLWDASMVGHE